MRGKPGNIETLELMQPSVLKRFTKLTAQKDSFGSGTVYAVQVQSMLYNPTIAKSSFSYNIKTVQFQL